MKILYIHQYFKTPEEGGAVRSYHIAKGMVDAGHKVELITSHNKTGYIKKNVDGIMVHYLPIPYSNIMSSFARVRSFYKFVSMATAKAQKIKDIDLCYATSTPLTVGYVALRLKEKIGVPYIFEVRDLWPDAPIELGVIKYQFLQNYFYALEKKIYAGAKRIIALSPDIKKNIEAKTENVPISMVPNFSDCDFFESEVKHPYLERKYNCSNQFTISYLGAIGKANHLQYLLDIAKECKKQNLSIQFLIGGTGAELKKLKKQTSDSKLDNIQFLGDLSKQIVKEVLSVSDATYTSFLNTPVLESGSPNKFFDSLASGKLTIVNTKGWLKELVETAQCGFYANPELPEHFVSQIGAYLNNEKLKSAQNNARLLAVEQFNKVDKINEVLSVLREA